MDCRVQRGGGHVCIQEDAERAFCTPGFGSGKRGAAVPEKNPEKACRAFLRFAAFGKAEGAESCAQGGAGASDPAKKAEFTVDGMEEKA